jgi:hypothetical protein
MKARACTVGAILLSVISCSGPAVALDITFDDVTSVGNPLVTALETHGYRFTAGAFRTIDAPGRRLVSDASAVYLGQVTAVPGLTLSRVDGLPFALYELAAAGLFATPPPGAPNAQQLSLLGLVPGGGLLNASYSLSLSGFTHVAAPPSWSNLQSVTFAGITSTGGPGALAVDDVGVGEGPVPSGTEPGTLLLGLATALGLGVMLLARSRRPDTRSRR